jgi:outer membrane immunogenic protein
MRQFLAVIAAGAAFVAVPALAADIPVKAPPPVAAFSWTGFYVGVNAGYGRGHHDLTLSTVTATTAPVAAFPIDAAAQTAAGSRSFREAGAVFGVHGGYNLQYNWLVVGVEADYMRTHLGVTSVAVVPFPSTPGTTFPVSTSINADWLATARGRLGVTWANAWGNTLLYGTGGYAVGDVHVYQVVGSLVTGAAFVNDFRDTRSGWVAGGGIEHAIGGGLLLRVEYLHADLGTETSVGTQNLPAGTTGNVNCLGSTVSVVGPSTRQGCTLTHKFTADFIRFGAAYKF